LRSDGVLNRVDKITRALDCDDSSGWSNDFGKIDSRITGTGANVEHMFADSDAGSLPAIQDDRTPDAVLQSEPGQFLVVRAEDVIAFRCHESMVANRGGFATRILNEIRAMISCSKGAGTTGRFTPARIE